MSCLCDCTGSTKCSHIFTCFIINLNCDQICFGKRLLKQIKGKDNFFFLKKICILFIGKQKDILKSVNQKKEVHPMYIGSIQGEAPGQKEAAMQTKKHIPSLKGFYTIK